MAEWVEHRAGGIAPRKAEVTGRLHKAGLIAAAVALSLFSGGILWSSGLLDGVVHRCSVEAGNGQCVDDIAQHLPR